MSPLKKCVSPKSSNDSKETQMVWPPFPQPCRNMSTHSATALSRTSALWPRQGQSQRLLSQCLQNLTTYNWIPFCFGRGQSTYKPLSWMMTPRALLGLQEATGVLSALMRSWQGDWSHHKGGLTQPFYCSFFPWHLEKALTSRSTNFLRGTPGSQTLLPSQSSARYYP